jgi:hypothetical protein
MAKKKPAKSASEKLLDQVLEGYRALPDGEAEAFLDKLEWWMSKTLSTTPNRRRLIEVFRPFFISEHTDDKTTEDIARLAKSVAAYGSGPQKRKDSARNLEVAAFIDELQTKEHITDWKEIQKRVLERGYGKRAIKTLRNNQSKYRPKLQNGKASRNAFRDGK